MNPLVVFDKCFTHTIVVEVRVGMASSVDLFNNGRVVIGLQ